MLEPAEKSKPLSPEPLILVEFLGVVLGVVFVDPGLYISELNEKLPLRPMVLLPVTLLSGVLVQAFLQAASVS
jgi:hypothetical protein